MKTFRGTRAILPVLAGTWALLANAIGPVQDYRSSHLTPIGAVSGKLAATSSGGHVGSVRFVEAPFPHAVLVGAGTREVVDLNPLDCFHSSATCVDAGRQGGWGASTKGVHALLWEGSSASVTDLHPAGFDASYCLGIDGLEQVGYAQNRTHIVTASHAMVWQGTASSAVDLHPGILPFSRALGCRGGEQVGYVSTVAYLEADASGYHTGSRAVRWNGTASSAVLLHPAGFDASEAVCTTGQRQAGWGYRAEGTSRVHALLWSGDAASVLDLHPTAFTESRVHAMAGNRQVGEGWMGRPNVNGSVRHALLWSGTADSVVDLNRFLPAGYTNAVATGIDNAGRVVGFAYNGVAAGSTLPPGAVAVVFEPVASTVSNFVSVLPSALDRVFPGRVVPASSAPRNEVFAKIELPRFVAGTDSGW